MEQCLYPEIKNEKNEKLYRISRFLGKACQRVKTEAQIGSQTRSDLRSMLDTAVALLLQGITSI